MKPPSAGVSGNFHLGSAVVPAGSGERLRGREVAAIISSRLPVYGYLAWQSATLPTLRGSLGFLEHAKEHAKKRD